MKRRRPRPEIIYHRPPSFLEWLDERMLMKDADVLAQEVARLDRAGDRLNATTTEVEEAIRATGACVRARINVRERLWLRWDKVNGRWGLFVDREPVHKPSWAWSYPPMAVGELPREERALVLAEVESLVGELIRQTRILRSVAETTEKALRRLLEK